jgi:hypothetical protein
VSVGDYRRFKIWEPKERVICASAFREQVLHHALMNVCHPYFERVQIYDSYASRKGKGTYAALARAQAYNCQYAWFAKLDVRKFFDSIHHSVVQQQLARMFKDTRLLAIFADILNSYHVLPQRGVPIGNLTSQYFANHYLAGLDHFIKEILRMPAYVRYMDDMVLWHNDKVALQAAVRAIETYLVELLHCALKPIIINRVAAGLPFLGYTLFPKYRRLQAAAKRRFIRKIAIIDANFHAGVWSETSCAHRARALIAFTRHADAPILRKNVYSRLNGLSS